MRHDLDEQVGSCAIHACRQRSASVCEPRAIGRQLQERIFHPAVEATCFGRAAGSACEFIREHRAILGLQLQERIAHAAV